jgi:K+-transporting ATPase ATPase A chain
MLLISVVAIFIAGLMVGRTPEYLGNKIETRETKLVMDAILVTPLFIPGFSMATASDNGSAFGGLNANTPWFNNTTAVAMLAGRFLHGVPIIALAGSLAAKTRAAPSAGTFPTHGPLFVGLLAGVIVIVGLLTYFPALALGPIVEHLLMLAGKSF